MWRERMDHRAVGDRNARADHHERLDGDVVAECGVGGEIDRIRRDQGDAGLERRLAQPRLHDLFGLGELGLGVDAAHFILAGFDHDGLQSHVPDDADRVGQIILALAVGIADLLDDLERAAAVERHHAGIAEIDLALGGAGLGMLADRHQPIALDQQPAVAGGIGGAKAEHGERRAVLQRRPQPRKCLGRNQRRVAERDQQIVGAAGDRLARRQHRMRGAEPLALDEGQRHPAAPARPPARHRRDPGRPPRRARRRVPCGAAASTCASSDSPATGCSTFGIAERMRVPSPAASTTVRLDRAGIVLRILMRQARPWHCRRRHKAFCRAGETE